MGLDWVSYLPLALCAIRSIPNRDTGFSPFELAFGKRMCGPLDIMYAGWVEDAFQKSDVCSWVAKLQEKLVILHECATANACKATAKRVETFKGGRT